MEHPEKVRQGLSQTDLVIAACSTVAEELSFLCLASLITF
jgi:hypothetical protein